jgi:hypothetical protein
MLRFFIRDTEAVEPLRVRERSDDRRRHLVPEVRPSPRDDAHQRHAHDLALQQEVRDEFAELRERLDAVRTC